MSIKSKSKIDKELKDLGLAHGNLVEVLKGEVYEPEEDDLLKKVDPDIRLDSRALELALDRILSVLKQVKKLVKQGP